LRDLFGLLSATTRYRYFGLGIPGLPAFAERVVALGMAREPRAYALVAECPGGIIGVARFNQDNEAPEAVIGILLADAWQSRGIGTRMLIQLAEAARLRSITHLKAQVIGENQRALRLVRKVFPGAKITWDDGAFDLRMCLSGMNDL
jgi:RimJ/RimL family protein N-acetyltransferase